MWLCALSKMLRRTQLRSINGSVALMIFIGRSLLRRCTTNAPCLRSKGTELLPIRYHISLLFLLIMLYSLYRLMEIWPQEFEDLLRTTPLPSPDLDLSLSEYAKVPFIRDELQTSQLKKSHLLCRFYVLFLIFQLTRTRLRLCTSCSLFTPTSETIPTFKHRILRTTMPKLVHMEMLMLCILIRDSINS